MPQNVKWTKQESNGFENNYRIRWDPVPGAVKYEVEVNECDSRTLEWSLTTIRTQGCSVTIDCMYISCVCIKIRAHTGNGDPYCDWTESLYYTVD